MKKPLNKTIPRKRVPKKKAGDYSGRKKMQKRKLSIKGESRGLWAPNPELKQFIIRTVVNDYNQGGQIRQIIDCEKGEAKNKTARPRQGQAGASSAEIG